jgi:hypothetical protein
MIVCLTFFTLHPFTCLFLIHTFPTVTVLASSDGQGDKYSTRNFGRARRDRLRLQLNKGLTTSEKNMVTASLRSGGTCKAIIPSTCKD